MSLRSQDGRVLVEGTMTLAVAASLLEQGTRALGKGQAPVFDLGGVTDVDSSGLAVVFGWQRAAQRAGTSIRVVNPPQSLMSLASLYGVREMLPLD